MIGCQAKVICVNGVCKQKRMAYVVNSNPINKYKITVIIMIDWTCIVNKFKVNTRQPTYRKQKHIQMYM